MNCGLVNEILKNIGTSFASSVGKTTGTLFVLGIFGKMFVRSFVECVNEEERKYNLKQRKYTSVDMDEINNYMKILKN